MQNKIKTVPPVKNISVNKYHVAFTDTESKKHIQFSDGKQTRNFIDWLLTVSDNKQAQISQNVSDNISCRDIN